MPYISKGQRGHAQWLGLAELLEIVQVESECTAEAAAEQIQNALADSEIWPLDWEQAPAPNAYCHTKYAPQAADFGKPVRPPPPCSKNLVDFVDRRSSLHWRRVRIDWKQGRVLDDFEHEAYRRIGRNLAGPFGPIQMPRPRSPEWRTLMLDRKACERLWPSRAITGSSEPHPKMSEQAVRQWVEKYVQDHVTAGTSSSQAKIWEDFNEDPEVKGRASRRQVLKWYNPPAKWAKPGRPPNKSC